MRYGLLVTALAAVALSQRPKIKDETGNFLLDLDEVGDSCSDSYTGYAIVEGSLERCENLTSVEMGADPKAYELFKCKHLRVHGEMKRDKCVCKDPWEGPACNNYRGCPADTPSLHNGACSKTGCANGGIMAIGTRHLECICKDHWDGRHCDRLACWRLTEKGFDRRRKNGKYGECLCGEHYEGENCATLKSCALHGTFANGRCVCASGYGGETCERKCGEDGCGPTMPPPPSCTSSFFTCLFAVPVLANRFY